MVCVTICLYDASERIKPLFTAEENGYFHEKRFSRGCVPLYPTELRHHVGVRLRCRETDVDGFARHEYRGDRRDFGAMF